MKLKFGARWEGALLCLLMVLACLWALPIRAEAASTDDLTFERNGDGYAIVDCDNMASGKLTIPSSYNGRSVTEIGEDAFSSCYDLTEVVIPTSVHTIAPWAFWDCRGLAKITISNSVKAIGEHAFDGCHSLTEVSVPASTEHIGSGAFASCSSLRKIQVSSSNKFYASDANGVLLNKGKTELILCPAGLSGSYTVPNTVTQIAESAFWACSKLTAVTLPGSVKQIGSRAFYDCDGLREIRLPTSVNAVAEGMFLACDNLKGIWVEQGNPYLSSDARGVLFNKAKTELLEAPVTLSGSYAVPGTVTWIQGYAFALCEDLETVTLPKSLSWIGPNAFYGCRSIAQIDIPNSVTHIEESAFGQCWNLKRITLGSALRSIGMLAFEKCYSLETIDIPEAVTEISDFTFSFCDSMTSIGLPAGLEEIGSFAFEECLNLKQVFFGGTSAQKRALYMDEDGNEALEEAVWHYGCQSAPGMQMAYYCADCDQVLWLDGTQSHFTDLLSAGWKYTAAKYAIDTGLMAGKGTDKFGRPRFDPDSPIARQEFVQVLYSAEGKPAVSSNKVFPDVKNEWYRNAVLWAYESGISSGLGTGSFGVGASIRRQDLAVMLYKYAQIKDYSLNAREGTINQFSDGGKVSDYAKKALDWAVTNGIMSGKGSGSVRRLDPMGMATRAECAAMLKKFVETFGN